MEAYYNNVLPASTGITSPYGFVADGVTAIDTGDVFHQLPRGRYPVSTIPRNQGSIFSTYKFANGFGVKGDLWVKSSWRYKLDNHVEIPGEHNLDLSVFYDQPRWRAQLDFLNVTNQRNFSATIGEGVDMIVPSEPFGIQAKFGYFF
jgi:hypothetical protein